MVREGSGDGRGINQLEAMEVDGFNTRYGYLAREHGYIIISLTRSLARAAATATTL